MYKTKVSGACKQDEDLLGEKFRYNKEDDIVLFFNEGKMDTAYCYKRGDLGRLLKNGYKTDNTIFSYMVSPHTNQYIVNPGEILNSRWHSFIVKPVRRREQYRRDYPETLYYVERGEDPIFEDAPEVGDEPVEEKIEIRPSSEYLETERKMREIRERRRETIEPEIRTTITYNQETISNFDRKKRMYDEYKVYFDTEKKEYLEDLQRLNNLLYKDEYGNEPPIVRVVRSGENIRRIAPSTNPNFVWIREYISNNIKTITWYKGVKKHRIADKPAEIRLRVVDNPYFQFNWYRDGRRYREDNKPNIFDSRGELVWEPQNPGGEFPYIVEFEQKTMEFIINRDNITQININFENGMFNDIDIKGKIIYYDHDGNEIEITYIPR